MSKRDRKREPKAANMISTFIHPGSHSVAVRQPVEMHGRWKIEKFDGQGRKYDERVAENCLLNLGINELLDLAFGLGGTAFAFATSRIGIAEGTTAADPTQTGLIGVSTHYEGMDGGYPVRVGQTVTVRATFAAGHGTGVWKEVVFDNGATALSRLLYDAGTKAAGDIWVVTGTFVIS